MRKTIMDERQERQKQMSVYEMLSLMNESHRLSNRYMFVSEEQHAADSKRREEIEQQLLDVGLQLSVDDWGHVTVYEG